MRGRGHEVIVIRILDPAETELAVDEPTEVFDMESGRRIYIDPDSAREAYLQGFQKHQNELISACDAIGAHWYQTLTSHPLQDALSRFVKHSSTIAGCQSSTPRSDVRRGKLRGASMSLLTPLYLLGALAVAAPIVFHLIRKQPRGSVPVSSLMFLQPSQPRITRRSRLDNWPLLLLRALALLLIAIAFARPYLPKQSANISHSTSRNVVLLIDTSGSMAARRPLETGSESCKRDSVGTCFGRSICCSWLLTEV